MYTRPSVFAGSESVDLTQRGSQIFYGGKKGYIVAEGCYVVRPPMAASARNTYRLFPVIVAQTIQYNNCLHSTYVVLGIISNLELI